MSRVARMEVFAPNEIATVFVTNHVVRRCFLMGIDPITGKNFNHRKVMIEGQLKRLARGFGIDLLGYALLSNQIDLIMRSRPDIVATWSDKEVARRWLLVCPVRKNAEGIAEDPNDDEINKIRKNKEKLAIIRLRLSDVAWWMRVLCQFIAVRANREDNEIGKFWQSRFREVRLLDDVAILACAAHVDLNPVITGTVKTLDKVTFTSVHRRIRASAPAKTFSVKAARKTAAKSARSADEAPAVPLAADRFLAPIELGNKGKGKPGMQVSRDGFRCSDKGFLSLTQAEYLEILDWTARQIGPGKVLTKPKSVPAVVEQLNQQLPSTAVWCELVRDFHHLFGAVAGNPGSVDAMRSLVNGYRYRLSPRARVLLPATESPASELSVTELSVKKPSAKKSSVKKSSAKKTSAKK